MLGIGTEPAFANGNRALLIQTGALKGLSARSWTWSLEDQSSACPRIHYRATTGKLMLRCTSHTGATNTLTGQHVNASEVSKPHAPILAGEGNILWDCITVLDDDTLAHIRSLGGIRAIAVSHPHFYTRMADWAEEFDATVYVHAADKRFIVQPSERISYWTGMDA